MDGGNQDDAAPLSSDSGTVELTHTANMKNTASDDSANYVLPKSAVFRWHVIVIVARDRDRCYLCIL